MKNPFASLFKRKIQDHSESMMRDFKTSQSMFNLLSSKSNEELIELLATDNLDDLDLNLSVWDELIRESALLIFENKEASAALLQQKLNIQYIRASKIIDQLETAKFIGPFRGENNREVFVKNKNKLDLFLNTIAYDKKLLNKFYIEHKYEIDTNREYFKELKEQSLGGRVKREPIPQEIMDKVWNRDGGKCVKCGGRQNLEFDHIIPFSKGGATTYRNLQLLCKKCNITKINNIG